MIAFTTSMLTSSHVRRKQNRPSGHVGFYPTGQTQIQGPAFQPPIYPLRRLNRSADQVPSIAQIL